MLILNLKARPFSLFIQLNYHSTNQSMNSDLFCLTQKSVVTELLFVSVRIICHDKGEKREKKQPYTYITDPWNQGLSLP